MEKKLEVKNLRISFKTANGKVQAVRNINFELNKGETLAIVGESGSGKSVTSKSMLGILAGNAIIESGEITVCGHDIMSASQKQLQKIRGGALPSRASAYAADYDLMGRLKRFADSHHIAVVLVHHLNKLKDVSDPYDRISGSTGLMGAADTTVLISRERGSDDATVSYTGRDVWGEDFHLRMQEGRWQAISAEARAREAFEKDDLVRLIRDLADEAIGGAFKVSLQGLMDAAADRYGAVIAGTKNELSRRLEELAPGLEEYDGIVIQTGKRVGSERGIHIVKGGRD